MDLRVLKVHKGILASLDRKGCRVRPALRVHKDRRAYRGRKEHKVTLARKVHKVRKAFRGHKDHKDHKVSRARQACPSSSRDISMPPQGTWERMEQP
jgi:hypothetical protein